MALYVGNTWKKGVRLHAFEKITPNQYRSRGYTCIARLCLRVCHDFTSVMQPHTQPPLSSRQLYSYRSFHFMGFRFAPTPFVSFSHFVSATLSPPAAGQFSSPALSNGLRGCHGFWCKNTCQPLVYCEGWCLLLHRSQPPCLLARLFCSHPYLRSQLQSLRYTPFITLYGEHRF